MFLRKQGFCKPSFALSLGLFLLIRPKSSSTETKRTRKQKHLRPNPQSQSFSRSYGSNLPTSLIYILLFDHRLFILETWCGYEYDQACKWHNLQEIVTPPSFQGSSTLHQTMERNKPSLTSCLTLRVRRIARSDTHSLAKPFPGCLCFPSTKEKKKLC